MHFNICGKLSLCLLFLSQSEVQSSFSLLLLHMDFLIQGGCLGRFPVSDLQQLNLEHNGH